MLRLVSSVRAQEKRDTWAAFVLLFFFIGSHSVLETARDALFLSKLPASRLPWMYIALALVSLVLTQIQGRVGRGLNRRTALSIWLGVACIVTFGFWLGRASLASGESAALYSLYVWSGVVTTLVLIHFWSLLGDIFSVTQAKRLYGLIGSGSVIGAIAGSAAASAVARVIEAQHLVLIAACGLGVSALVPPMFRQSGESAEDEDAERGGEEVSLLARCKFVQQNPYARRLAMLVIVSSAALTLADYIFKSTVAATVPPEQLGSYFATVYLVLNTLSLVVQLTLLGWLLKRFNLSITMGILPALLLVGGVGVLAWASLAAALVIKGADGALKHTIHRTTTELLYVPLSERARASIKSVVDVMGGRGGQSVASLTILVVGAVHAPPSTMAVVLLVLSAVWLMGVVDLRRHYLEIFRSRVRRSGFDVDLYPELDLASLETLIATLDSTNDWEVIAALDVLEREDRAHLVPALILYHPSPDVVERALDLFTRAERKDVLRIVDRLLDQPSPKTRSAAIAARSVLDPNERILRMRLSTEESAEVRATIMINLVAMGAIFGGEARDTLGNLIKNGGQETRIAIAKAIGRRRSDSVGWALQKLASLNDRQVQIAAARAMGRVRDPALIPTLISLLGHQGVRGVARRSLLNFGSEAVEAVFDALENPRISAYARWEIPRIIAQLDEPQPAAERLLCRIAREPAGMIRYRLIRALELLTQRNPEVVLDERALNEAISNNLARAYRYLDRRLILERGARNDPRLATDGNDLLRTSLKDKETHTIERLFRLLGLAHPTEEFVDIYLALENGSEAARSSSIELIENILEPPLRHAVVGLVDDIPDEQRLSVGASYHPPLKLSYQELLQHMLRSTSSAVQDLTAFHIGELRLQDFKSDLEDLAAEAPSSDVRRALTILQPAVTHAG